MEETPADAQWGEPSTAIDATTAMNNAMTVTSRHLNRGLEHTQGGTLRAPEYESGSQSAREADRHSECERGSDMQVLLQSQAVALWHCGTGQWYCCSDTGSGIVALGSGTVAVTQAVALWHWALALLQ